MPIITRSQQYSKFWHDLAHLTSGGMDVQRALESIANSFAHNKDKKDKFYLGIMKMSKNIWKKGRGLSETMRESGLFSQVEINIIMATEVFFPLEMPSCAEWERAINQLMDSRLLTTANQYILFYKTFGTLLDNKLPILQAVRISSNGLGDPLKSAVEMIEAEIKDGGDVSTAMRKSGAFSIYECSLMTAAEERGERSQGLLQLASDCRFDS